MVASAYRLEGGFREIKQLCYAGLEATTLLREVAGHLRSVIPFEAYCAHTNDPLSGLLTNLISDGIIGSKEHDTYLKYVYLEEDWHAQRSMINNRTSVALLSEVTDDKLEGALHSREITLPLGLGYELLNVFAVEQQQWGAVCLIRARGRPDFDMREVALLQQVSPHVSAGLKTAVLQSRALAGSIEDTLPGALILDDQGRVVQYTETAERWLRDLNDFGPGWLEGRGLPTPVWMVVAALRKALKPETDKELNRIPRIRVQTRSGHWLTLHGSQTSSQAGRQGETVVIVEPSKPQELAWLRAAAYGLSERERAVVECVLQGYSTREIAKRLFISEYTVQEHLSNIFDKVGVRGRRALVKHLFLENIDPVLTTSSEDQ